MKHFLLLTLLVTLALPIGCTRGTESTPQAARETRMTDSDLEKKIDSQFKADPAFRDSNISVDADADRNHVTLSGTVSTEAMRTRAVEMARNVQPGLVIDDKIDVKPRLANRSEYTPEMARTEVDRARTRNERVGSGIDDAWIHAKVVGQLIGDTDTPEHRINVDVDHNIVTLRGTVNTMQEKQEAERIAKQTDGVKSVKNMLKVDANPPKS
jgi:hyperosmotically inducible periplasmic protein